MPLRRAGTHYVYIVECKDGSYYTGYTPDIEKRVATHNKGRGALYTKFRRPVKLVWHKRYRYFRPAFLMEMRIKTLKRGEKETLVAGRRLDRVLRDAKR